MNLLNLFNDDNVNKFIKGSFISNYIQENPLSYFYELINTPHKDIILNEDLEFNIGSFKLGESYRNVRRQLDVIYKIKKNIYLKTVIKVLMGVENLKDVQRISVYYFLNNSLFAMKYNFPFINQDEIKIIHDLIMEKYGIKEHSLDNSAKYIHGKNKVVLKVRNFVSLSYEFFSTDSFHSNILQNSTRLLKNQDEMEFQKTKREFLLKI